jgi:hypothetical protein
MPRSEWTWAALISTALTVAVADYQVVDALDFADTLASVLCFVTLLVLSLLPFLSWPVWPEWIKRRITRAGTEHAAVYLFASLFLILALLPTPFPPYDGRWWVWKGTAVLCLVMAVAVVLVPSRRHSTLMPVSGTFVLLLVVGIAANRWWPARDMDDCGAAQIAVDTRLRSQVATALMGYQDDPQTRSASCSDALKVVEAGDDLHEQLLTAVPPLAAVVTSDPSILRGLDGAWTNLGIQPAAHARWRTIGLDPAAVLLSADERQGRESVDLSALPALRVGRWAPFDPVALAVMTAPTSHWNPAFPRPHRDGSAAACPAHVVLAARSTTACSAPGRLLRTDIVDQDGNPIGAPVLGIDLTFASSDQRWSPTGRAQDAAKEFLTWLDNNPGKLGLQTLTQPIADALAPMPRQSALIRQEAQPHPVHVTVVLDASLSMGRATDPRTYGAAAPWQPSVDGLKRWFAGAGLGTRDRLSIVLAQSGAGSAAERTQDPVTGPLGRTWPVGAVPGKGGVPRGETALPDALRQARRVAGAHAEPGRRQLIVLLTDGVNAFREHPVPASALAGVRVVVVRPGNGCAALPDLVRTRCRTADITGPDVAAQLSAVVSTARAGHEPPPAAVGIP